LGDLRTRENVLNFVAACSGPTLPRRDEACLFRTIGLSDSDSGEAGELFCVRVVQIMETVPFFMLLSVLILFATHF
jgi:hypothetical protein